MTLPDWSSSNVRTVGPILDDWATIYGLPREIVYGLVSQESRFNPNAIGDAGRAHGLTQIWLPTAQGLGYQGDGPGLQEPNVNVQFGLLYLRTMLDRFGTMERALSAYNGGLRGGQITNPAYVDGVLQRAGYFEQLWASEEGTETPLETPGDSGTNGSGLVVGLVVLASVLGVVALARRA